MNAKESLLNSLTEERRAETLSLASMFSLTEQMELELVKNQADLMLFDMPSLADLINLNEILILDNGQRRNAFLSMMRKTMMEIEKSEIDYSSFPTYRAERGEISVIDDDSQLGFGRCPCPIDGEKTRCCKLTTLDVITQCAVSCSYCSVQAFYDRMRIKAVFNLREKLDALHIDDSVWHIGTGQASDSLFLGDDHGTLSDLAYFSEKHPNIMIELKSKAYRTDIFKRKYPRNMVFTWSLNAPTVIEKEERVFRKPWERLFSTIKPFPGLRDALSEARDKGYILAALSDFPIGSKLKALGIDDLISFRASTEDFGALKPSVRPFRMMLSELGVKPEEALYTGDSCSKDIDGARNAGMHTALISHSVRVYNNADIIFSSWAEFRKVVL